MDSLVTSIKHLASQGNLSKAFKTFSLVQNHASSTGSYDIVLQPISSLLVSCADLKLLTQGKQLHAYIVMLGFVQHPSLVPKLVDFYSSFNLLVDAHVVTENSNILHTLPWNLLIYSYVRNGCFGEALSAYKQMVNKGIRPDNFTYPSVLKACGEKSDLVFGREVHKSIECSPLQWSLVAHNAVLAMYGKFGLMDVARYLFDKMPERDTISWNTMISGYAAKGMWRKAFEVFESMWMEGGEVNIVTWNTIAGSCLRTGKFMQVLELFSQMRASGFQFDAAKEGPT